MAPSGGPETKKTAMTSSVTESSVLEGNELMEYLFETEFHRDVMDNACYAKLKTYGYWDRLGFFQRFCLCRLLCIPPHVNHKLDDIDQKRVAEARQHESKMKSKEGRFGAQLNLTVGVTAACGVLIVVGVVGKRNYSALEATVLRHESETALLIAIDDLLFLFTVNSDLLAK